MFVVADRLRPIFDDQPSEQEASTTRQIYTVQLPYFLDFQYAGREVDVTFADGRSATLMLGADGQVYIRLIG